MALKENPAKGQKGFLLYDHAEKTYIFRIYNPKDKRKFKDYSLKMEDLEIQILDKFTSLYENDEECWLDYNSKVIGKRLPLPEKKPKRKA